MTEHKKPEVGEHIIFHDSRGEARNAVITAVYSDTCVNAVYVSGDESRQDSYGRQTERTASCNHKSMTGAFGNYWRYPSEEPREFNQPLAA